MNRDIFVLSDDDLAFVNGGSGYGNPKPNPQAGLPSSVLRQGAKWFAKGAGWEVGRHTTKAVWHTASGPKFIRGMAVGSVAALFEGRMNG
jgi:hypothetical protein